MSGYMMVYGPCFVCGRTFGFHAEHVPSYRGPETNEQREPICPECIQIVNARRRAEGRPEWPVHPDAYEPEPV